MLVTLVTTILSLLMPKAPSWLPQTIGLLLPAVLEVVDELRGAELEGPQKLKLAITEIGEQFDVAFDFIPEWSELPEARRDVIVTGLVELALFLASLPEDVSKRGSRSNIRKAVRKLKKA